MSDRRIDRQTDVPHPNRHRYRAALLALGKSPAGIAAAAGCSVRHLEFWLAGSRPLSARLAAGVEHELGRGAWDFVIGRSDTLTAPPVLEDAANMAGGGS